MTTLRVALLLVAAFAPLVRASTAFTLYLAPPAVQSSSIAGVTTETFDSVSTGNHTSPFSSAIGTYLLSVGDEFNIHAADSFGGANGTRYMTFGAQSGTTAPIELDLAFTAAYFGFWWSAGDGNNGISLYMDDTLLIRFTTADVLAMLTPTTGHVTALDASTYSNSLYYGNPNNSKDASEPFAYIHLVASGPSFNKIVFDNSGALSSGFESDNHSILATAPTLPNSLVFVSDLPLETPEAAPGWLMLGGIAVFGVRGWKRGRRN